MRVVAVHRDVLVVTSRMWQTNATAVRAGGEAMLIDSPYFPDELEALPALLSQAGFGPAALVATHADFDHVLGRLAFPELALGLPDTSFERLQASPGEPQRELRDFDAQHYVTRERPLSLGSLQRLPLPGKLELGDRAELELHPAEGHTADGMAVFARFAGVLVCGDYLSDVEIPCISPGGSLAGYRATLERLAPLVEAADSVIPGHGAVQSRSEAQRIMEEDFAYLDVLERGERRLPKGRDTKAQRKIHDLNSAHI
jgi:glyoxylase-like metal-dependent hydrolase (beta-lactamase superfamily II)